MEKRRLLKIRTVAKELFQGAGPPIDDVALDFGLKMAQDPQFQQLVNRPEQIAAVNIVAGFLHEFSDKPDLSEEQFEKLLQEMKQMAYGLRPRFRDGIRAVIKGLPKKPSTGRNEILDTQKRKKAIGLVSKYHEQGLAKKEAYEKVGREMNCSARTVQRAWRARGTPSSTAKT